jgi:hypothetical protein
VCQYLEEVMSIRTITHELCPPLLWRCASKLRAKLHEHRRITGDVIPWGAGYNEAKNDRIRATLATPGLMERFTESGSLPLSYGVGIDERCIEYPWFISKLGTENSRLLDAGSTLNYAAMLDLPQISSKKLHIVTLAPEGTQFADRGVGYLYEDLCSLPLQDQLYDIIACISTLEHVGCDNTLYTHDNSYAENRPNDYLLAIKEMARVLKPGGALFLTVPFGKYAHHRSFQLFDDQCWPAS